MHTVIKRRTGIASLNLRELWDYRELLGFLAWRDVVVRYKQTYIGAGWAFIRPFLTMVVFILILLVGFIYVWKKGALQWD